MRTRAGRAAKSITSPRTRPCSPKWSIFAEACTALPHVNDACMRESASSAVGGAEAGGATWTHPVDPSRPPAATSWAVARRVTCLTRLGAKAGILGAEPNLLRLGLEHLRAGDLVDGERLR